MSEEKPSFDLNTNPDDFKVIRLLGCGGFGQVLEIVYIPTGKHYAGKLFVNLDENELKEVNKEMDIMKSVYSEYTVNLYGTIKYPKNDPHFMIIMDYCDRGSLRDIMDYNEEKLTEDQLSFVMNDLLKALSLLHNKYKTIHRDIKAANILMSSDCSLKVTDFGISRKFNENSKIFTKSMMGTPYWMAPEVILGDNYSFPIDIWSVGATAVELIDGAPPYCEFPPTRAFNEIVANGFPGFRNGSSVSDQLKDFVTKCMIYNPKKRPTADQLLTHPFVRRIEKLNRQEVFKKLLSTEINFNDLIDDEDIENIQKLVTFEISPEYNQMTNIYENRQNMKTFVKQAAPGAPVNTIYIKENEDPTIKETINSIPNSEAQKSLKEPPKQSQEPPNQSQEQPKQPQDKPKTLQEPIKQSTELPKNEAASSTPASIQKNNNLMMIGIIALVLLLAFILKH